MPLTDLQRAALQMLAKSPRGYALSTAMARGFSFEMLQRLVRVGYATSHRDMVGTRKEKLPHLGITEAGRKAIGGFYGRSMACHHHDLKGIVS